MISATHLHAMVVHFPIALLLLGFLSELIAFIFKNAFFKQAAFYLLIIGTLGTIASYFVGNVAGEGIEGGSLGKVMELHEQAALFSVWLSITTTVVYLLFNLFWYRKIWVRIMGMILFTAVISAVVRTGYLGGQLVYKHGAGVQLALPDFTDPGIEKDE